MRTLLLLLAILLTAHSVTAQTTLSGTVYGSFNGGPFTLSASLHNVTFTGGAFTLQSHPDSNNVLIGTVGSLSYTGIQGLTGQDTFAIRLVFDPAHAATPSEMILTWTLSVHTATRVVQIRDGSDPSITFTSGGTELSGNLIVEYDILKPSRTISNGRGIVFIR